MTENKEIQKYLKLFKNALESESNKENKEA